MTLLELAQVIEADQTIMIRCVGGGEYEMIEATPEDVINEYKHLHDAHVLGIWASMNLYRAIIIDIE